MDEGETMVTNVPIGEAIDIRPMIVWKIGPHRVAELLQLCLRSTVSMENFMRVQRWGLQSQQL